MDGCELLAVRRDGIRVRRSVISHDADLLVKFSVESDRGCPVAVRISDASVTPERAEIDAGLLDEECRWTTNEHGVTFSRSIVPGDSFVTEYRIVDSDRTDVSWTPPVVETVQPIDERDIEAGIAPQWRGSGGAASNGGGGGAVGLTTGGGLATESRPAGKTRGRSETAVDDTNESIDSLVAIPAYNEAGAIADVVSQAKPHADEVLVVDDGSSDDTAARARDAGATVVRHERNRGYGAAIRRTFREADRRDVDTLVVVDGDGQHDPNDIPRLLDRQADDHPRIVIGSRFVGTHRSDIPVYRRFGLWIVNAMTNVSMGTIGSNRRITDTQSGFRAYNAMAIRSLAGDGSIGAGMGASTDVLHHARQHDFNIEEVGTKIEYDVEHASSHNPITHGLALVSNLLYIIERDHPIALLGVPGFVSLLVGFGFGYWMISNFVTTGTFPLGLAIITTFFSLIGIFACFTAIVLHSLNTHLSRSSPDGYGL